MMDNNRQFKWAEQYPEIHKICTLFSLNGLSNPKCFSYKSLPQFLQDGPQCGLVALAILTGNPTKQSVDEIFQHAKRNGYTFNGEMFSAQQMSELARIFLKQKRVELFSGDLNCEYIRDNLIGGAQMLVPYDTNKDNSPGLHQGHKAHWCVISGAVDTVTNFFVMARHGKARNVQIWGLQDLAASNSQLNEFSPDRDKQDLEYKLPEGGINGPRGLNRQAVLLFD